MKKRTKPKPTRKNVDKSPDKSPAATEPAVVIDASGRRLFGVAADPSLRGPGRGPAVGAPNAGRPPDAFRAKMRLLLAEDGIEVAREILRGNPDQAGNVPNHDLRVRLLGKLTEIGFNERMRTKQLEADAAATAASGSKAQAGVQIIMQGGPAGNERTDPSP